MRTIILSVLAALSFLGSQIYLFFRLKGLDGLLDRRKQKESDKELSGYPQEDMVE